MAKAIGRIEVHYREPDGKTGVVNYFSGENAAVSGSSGDEAIALFDRLKAKAIKVAATWGSIFSNTNFYVKEI